MGAVCHHISEQVLRLISMKEKAVRIRRARLQQRVIREELAKKQEAESNLVEQEARSEVDQRARSRVGPC